MTAHGTFGSSSPTGSTADAMPPLVRTPVPPPHPSPVTGDDLPVSDPLPFERPLAAAAQPALGPTGRPMPQIPEPAPVSEHGNARVVSMCNQKGGVGKTTTTVNLAAGLAAQGQRVLLVDLDPQGNASMGSGINKHTLEFSVYQVLVGLATIPQARQRSEAGRYDVLPANRDLAGAEVELVDLEHRENRLKLALAEVEADYDFVLIDCPPSLSLLTLNGLCAAHGVVVPMQCEYFALEGLSDLVNTIKQVHANLNRDLKVIGLLRVMFDPRVTLQQQVSAQLESHFGDKVFKTVIPRNVRLAEAPSYGMPGVAFDVASKGAKAYLDFGAEMIARVRQMADTPA